jgi:cytochrome P450
MTTMIQARETPAVGTARRAPGPRRFSPIGSIWDFKRDILRAMAAGWKEHGDLVRYRLGPVVVHGVSSPELAEEVLTDGAVFGKLGPDNPLRLVLGNGLLTSSDHPSWLRNRRMMQPIFHRQSINKLFDSMVACTEDMVAHLAGSYGAGDVIDLHKAMMRVTLDIVSQCMFSANVMDDLDRIGPHAVDIAVNYAFQRLQNPFCLPHRWPTPRNRRFHGVMKALDDLVFGMIAQRRGSDLPKNDLLDMLLKARDQDTGEGMSDRQLRDEILTMFAAGHETTAITLTWTFYLLSQHPEILRKVQSEVDAALGGRMPTLADLPRMPYTLQVFEESMRLYPSAPIIPRLTSRETTLGGYTLPAHSRVLVNLFNIHRHDDYWLEPEAFDPDRFAPDVRKVQHRCAYIPFGAGPHVCIGKHFALMEAHLLLASLAQRYEFRHLPSHRVVNHATITLRPRHGMLMTIHPRRRPWSQDGRARA